MAFIQIIEFTTDDITAVQAIDEEWLKATEGKRTARREVLTRDRNNPDRYFSLVFFDSYDSAMQNSQLPETQTAAQKYQAATKDVAFYDLDVVAEYEGM